MQFQIKGLSNLIIPTDKTAQPFYRSEAAHHNPRGGMIKKSNKCAQCCNMKHKVRLCVVKKSDLKG